MTIKKIFTYPKINKILFTVFLILFFPLVSNAFILNNFKIATELGIGTNLANIAKPSINETLKKNYESDKLEIDTNYTLWNLGIMIGYKFLDFIEPEIGIKICPVQYYGFKDYLSIEEKPLNIPMRVNFLWNIIPMIKIKGILGYKLSIILSSKYIVKDKMNEENNPYISKNFIHSINDLKKNNDTFVGKENYFLCGLGASFPFGIYCNFIVTIPIINKKKLKKYSNYIKNNKNASPRDKYFYKPFRILSYNVFQFQLGVDLMDII